MGSGDQVRSGASTPLQYDKPLPPLRNLSDESWFERRQTELRERNHVPPGSYEEKPLPPINVSASEPFQGPRKPNMSLFSLFSKPRVQKLRGYAESGLATPRRTNDANASRADLSPDTESVNYDLARSGSSMSGRTFRTHKTHGSGNTSRHAPIRRTSSDHRSASTWDPPPLFQAFARSTKHGLVEISTASPETVMAKSRARRIGALQLAPEATPRGSMDTSRSSEPPLLGRFASKTSGSVHITQVELERKIFVLVTTGHLLQYSEYGPSGRLPERVLFLCENSAAFASDLIGGRPHVAQISQAVDSQGLPVPPASSMFSRMGIKSSAAKKMLSDVLLVLPDGNELNTWLSAVRKQIEELGGPASVAPSDPEAQYLDSPEVHDSQRSTSPAPMQRYHIKPPAEAMDAASAPTDDTQVSPIEIVHPEGLPSHMRAKSRNSVEEAEAFADMLAAGASYKAPAPEDDEAFAEKLAAGASYKEPAPQEDEAFAEKLAAGASYKAPVPEEDEDFANKLAAGASYGKPVVEDDEAFANKLAAGASQPQPSSTRGRRPSDAPSASSSVAQSVDHLRLNSLRNSVRMSTNTNVTGWTSRTNSLTSEHGANKQSMESPSEAYGPRGPYRNLSSYSTGKRRSAMPSQPPVPTPPKASIDLTLQTNIPSQTSIDATKEDSPVTGWNSSPLTALPTMTPRGKVLSSRKSMPLLSEGIATKHDSKMSPPPPISEDGERPQSFVGDLPPAHWTAKLSPTKRGSTIPALPTDRQMHRMSSAPTIRTPGPTSAPRQTRRNTSQPFSLPLKINPSGSPSAASWSSSRQMGTRKNSNPTQHSHSSSPSSSDPETPVPRIHTLEAQIAPRSDSQPGKGEDFKPRVVPNNHVQEDSIPHNPPAAATTTTKPSPPQAPKRLSIFPPSQPQPAHPLGPISAPPISKPGPGGRPISIVQFRTCPAGALPTTTNPNHPSSTTRSYSGAHAPRAAPIRSLKPSRSGNAFRERTSLPVLDLGIPVVGLGPPAPPPSAPLPAPPTLGGVGRPRSALPSVPGLPPVSALPALPALPNQ